jgi:hypothetical protein
MDRFLSHILALEKLILRDYKKSSFDLKKFPQIATKALHSCHFNFKYQDFLLWTVKQFRHPDIHHYDVNLTENVHFTLVRNPHFIIEIYSWINHTEIHAHNFSGSFRVLRGRYAQSRYSFKKEHQKKNCTTGVLKLERRESATEGATFPITEGESFIHQVFHFDLPCISLCVRTPDTKKKYYSYFYPGLRVSDTTFKRPEILRIKSFAQLVKFGAVDGGSFDELLKGLSLSALVYDYMDGLNFLKQILPTILQYEKRIESHLGEALGKDMKELKRQHLLHMNKLELCEN